MAWLFLILAVCYAATWPLMLWAGMQPVVPWRPMLDSTRALPIVVVMVASYMGLERAFGSRAERPAFGILTGLLTLILFRVFLLGGIIYLVCIIAAVLLAPFVLRRGLPMLLASFGLFALFQMTVWNANYLLGKPVLMDGLRDAQLFAFDLWLYDTLGLGGASHLFPLSNNPFVTFLMESGYYIYYLETFFVFFFLARTGGNITRFFTLQCIAYAIGLACFYFYPAIGPIYTFRDKHDPEIIHKSNTGQLMELSYREIDQVMKSRPLGGTFYIIAMPSLHVCMAVLMQAFLWPNRHLFWTFLPINGMIALSTVYLGYHYVLDIPAGIFLGLALLAPAWWLDRVPQSSPCSRLEG
jgi:membrane-associated phospholipid phosphatase